MRREKYSAYGTRRTQSRPDRRKWLLPVVLLVVLAGGFAIYKLLAPSPVERAVNQLQFDGSVTEAEEQLITQAVKEQGISFDGDVTVSIKTAATTDNTAHILDAFIPVTDKYAVRQGVTEEDLKSSALRFSDQIEPAARSGLVEYLGVNPSKAESQTGTIESMASTVYALAPLSQLSPELKLLRLDDAYYLDSFTSGGLFRQAVFSGENAAALDGLKLNSLPGKDGTLKVNQTGVTALTRLMQRKLPSVGPTYFSEKIGSFLADADITHVSNEVSFRTGCQYSNVSFCSPPEFIETLKASGVDLVELTGNHNNDNGSTYNTDSINLYHGLGWHTFGGGLNAEEARKPYIADQKGSKVAFIGYNMADGPGSGAIAGTTTAGANLYTEDKAREDIAAAKAAGQFVIVDIQYAECQAYPAGYIEFPECDRPIGGQQEAFRKMIDLGADMVIGSSAHQPQTYEFYKDKPIYYGLGNLYFEQVQWPGTERGIVLTHYFQGGKLVQTKLSPTVYDRDFQTRLMDTDEAKYLLGRLNAAR